MTQLKTMNDHVPAPQPALGLRIGNARVLIEVPDYAAASALFRELRDRAWDAGRKTPQARLYRDGTLVATVSNNGRVWPPGPWKPSDEPLYDPSAATGVTS